MNYELNPLKQFNRMLIRRQDSNTPCDKCSAACCRSFKIIELTKQERHRYKQSGGMIKMKSNGECFYLKDNKCSIYDKRPHVCQKFDCRDRDSIFVTDIGLLQHGKPDPVMAADCDSRDQRLHVGACQIAAAIDGGSKDTTSDGVSAHILKNYRKAKKITEKIIGMAEELSPEEQVQLHKVTRPIIEERIKKNRQELDALRGNNE